MRCSITRLALSVVVVIAVFSGSTCDLSYAVSPMSIQQGRQLFQHQWTVGNPSIGSDGLGPLFNGNACSTCHNQGGVGGGGAAEFNALTIGIEQLRIRGGLVDNDVVATLLRSFHPGFIQSDGTMINALPLAHHGGTPAFVNARFAFLKQLGAEFSPAGGPVNAEEVRYATATPVNFANKIGSHQMTLQARLFQRNTTSLFGAGLIDQIPDSLIREQVRLQKRHPEISGRPSTLRDGRYGKFGWRANVASLIEFTDQACANEVGLETRRKRQADDPTNPGYRNTGVDISDPQIKSMTSFIASLPAPIRHIPSDTAMRLESERGEQLFASIGCAICHTPSMGPAKGIYSDMLLHDMGYEFIDLNHAEPYILRATPQTRVSLATDEQVTGTRMVGGYYGPATQISVNESSAVRRTGDFASRNNQRNKALQTYDFNFVAPAFPASRMQMVDLAHEDFVDEEEFEAEEYDGVRDATVRRKVTKRVTEYVRLHFEPTKFNQEWRTPPLWGVADSAPYMHDGRAGTLLEAVAVHGGEAGPTRDRFLDLSLADRSAVIAFMETLVAPQEVN